MDARLAPVSMPVHYRNDSFLFSISYFAAPGIFIGFVNGDAPLVFSGNAVLKITDTSTVPKPVTLTLLGLGLVGLGFARRNH